MLLEHLLKQEIVNDCKYVLNQVSDMVSDCALHETPQDNQQLYELANQMSSLSAEIKKSLLKN
jgi:hypothetical protein